MTASAVPLRSLIPHPLLTPLSKYSVYTLQYTRIRNVFYGIYECVMRTRQLCKLDLRRTHSHSHSQTATAASMSRARCASCCTPAPPLAGRSALDPPPPPPPPLRPAGPSPAAARAALVTASAPAARSAYRRVSGATASETASAICSSVLLMCSALLCSAVFAFAFAGARVVHSDRSVAYANGVALRSLYRFIFSRIGAVPRVVTEAMSSTARSLKAPRLRLWAPVRTRLGRTPPAARLRRLVLSGTYENSTVQVYQCTCACACVRLPRHITEIFYIESLIVKPRTNFWFI